VDEDFANSERNLDAVQTTAHFGAEPCGGWSRARCSFSPSSARSNRPCPNGTAAAAAATAATQALESAMRTRLEAVGNFDSAEEGLRNAL
jgi:hypothetical protein